MSINRVNQSSSLDRDLVIWDNVNPDKTILYSKEELQPLDKTRGNK